MGMQYKLSTKCRWGHESPIRSHPNQAVDPPDGPSADTLELKAASASADEISSDTDNLIRSAGTPTAYGILLLLMLLLYHTHYCV